MPLTMEDMINLARTAKHALREGQTEVALHPKALEDLVSQCFRLAEHALEMIGERDEAQDRARDFGNALGVLLAALENGGPVENAVEAARDLLRNAQP